MALNREAMKALRKRYRAQGLCGCGKSRMIAPNGNVMRCCERCLDKARKTYHRHRGVAFRVQMIFDPEEVVEWREFCDEFDMTLTDAVRDAMELYIETTHKAEAAERALMEEREESAYELKAG